MTKKLEISVEELLIRALKACIAMVPWLDSERQEKAQELYDICDKPVPEFREYVRSTLPNMLHVGEPLQFAIELVGRTGFEPTEHEWANIQCEVSDILTEEWLEQHATTEV